MKRKKNKKGKRVIFYTKRGSEESEREQKKREKEGKLVFRFFLRSTKIELSVFVRARRKVDLSIASYAWVPKS